MTPFVSVIIPAYNPGPLILETVNSVLSQTHETLEIILIDDGSADDTIERLKTIDDPRLKVFSCKNGGLAIARNRGIAQASGDFIAFLDHDDLWTPHKLEDQLNALLEQPNAGVAYSWTTYFQVSENGSKRYFSGIQEVVCGNVLATLLQRNFIESGSNILVRRDVVQSVGGFDAAPQSNEDWDFYLRLAAQSAFVVVPKFQILYRQASGSMSSQVLQFEQGGLTLIDKIYQIVPSSLQYLRPASLSNHYRYCAELYLNSGSQNRMTADAWRSLWESLRVRPITVFQFQTQLIMLKLLLVLLLSPVLLAQLQRLRQQRWSPNPPADKEAEIA